MELDELDEGHKQAHNQTVGNRISDAHQKRLFWESASSEKNESTNVLSALSSLLNSQLLEMGVCFHYQLIFNY